ncbi:hypothetical protein E0K83_13250 [Gramella sp. BOM4]|nr:hypothetical protein [Christiangramia bathymodioli]
MAPIKFEEHIKEQLDKREIVPSEGSWDKLNSRLDKAEKKPLTRWWMSAAAAVAVILVASLLFTSNQQDSIPIVDKPVEEIPGGKQQMKQSEIQVAVEEKAGNDDKAENKVVNGKNVMEAKARQLQNKTHSSVAAQSGPKKREQFNPISVEPTDLEKVAETKIDLNAKIFYSEIKKENDPVESLNSVSEVDALLAEATKDMRAERKNIGARVAADMLLNDVEYELDQSFRKEVFDFLKDEFLKAKTAIATRND